jgi:glycosyltransferase involved in cell wall biosynthesis
MRILFVHQNFPAQFIHLAPALKARGHDVHVLTFAANKRPFTLPTTRYDVRPPENTDRLGTLVGQFAVPTIRGEQVGLKAAEMRAKGYEPDFIFGHLGWGETLFLKEVWPKARLALYAEFFYHTEGLDCGFDPEIYPLSLASRMRVTAKQASLLLAMLNADKALAPTRWQADAFPDWFRQKIFVNHDGIDTELLRPNPQASVQLAQRKIELKAGDEVLTFVNRNLEPYRGYHIFMRALPKVLAARPKARVVIVGADHVSYGGAPPAGKTWKQIFLAEVKDRLDLSRVHFVGQVPYASFVSLMQVSRVHAYLTYPFVLSWSMLEAMACGAPVLGSSTPPVREMISEGVNGYLFDFFDREQLVERAVAILGQDNSEVCAAARRKIESEFSFRGNSLPAYLVLLDDLLAAP